MQWGSAPMRMETWLWPPTVRKYGRPRCDPPMEQQPCSTCRPHPPARLSPSSMVTPHPTPHSFPYCPCLPLSFPSFENRALPSKIFQFYTWSKCLHDIPSACSNTQEWACWLLGQILSQMLLQGLLHHSSIKANFVFSYYHHHLYLLFFLFSFP